MVLKSDSAESNLPPAASDEPVDEHTAESPHLPPGDAGWVAAEEVVAGATVDRGPVEDIRAAKEFLHVGR